MPEILLVFKHLNHKGKNALLVARMLRDGWFILSENKDRWYFQRELKAKALNAV